jgi:hypothetical protein
LSGKIDSTKRNSDRLPRAEAAKAKAEQSSPALSSSLALVLELAKGEKGIRGDAELYEALQTMRAEDFRDSVALWTDEVRKKLLDDKVRGGAILDRWFELDPVSAKTFAKKICTPAVGTPNAVIAAMNLCETVAASAARSDPKWALENLLLETDYPHFANPSGAIMFEVAQRDEALAKEWLKRTEGSKQHGLLLPGYVRSLAKRDPSAAVEIAMAEKGFERVNLVPTAIEAAAPQGRGLMLEALAKIDDLDLRRRAALSGMRVLARETSIDPIQFFEDTIRVDHLSENWLWQFPFDNLLESNATATAKWVEGLPPEHRSLAASQMLERWMQVDPQAVHAWVESHNTNSSGSPDSTLTDLGHLWTAKDLLDANKPKEAIAALCDVRNGGEMVGNIAWGLTLADPVATSQLALDLPDCKARETIAGTVAAYWTPRDPQAAAKWVEQLPPGPTRDAALLTMISSVADQAPESAGAWVNLYTDPQRQMITIRQIYGRWTARDPQAARNWLRSLTCVDERWKTKFLRQNP